MQNIDNLIQKLNGHIKKLWSTLPCGSKDGPLMQHFPDHTYDAMEGRISLDKKRFIQIHAANLEILKE